MPFNKKKETPLLKTSAMLYQGEEIPRKDIASGKVFIYEDRLEMQVQRGNSVKNATGALLGAALGGAIGGAIGAGIASSAVSSKGGLVTWPFREMAQASIKTGKKQPRLVVTMKDNSFYTFALSTVSASKCMAEVAAMVDLINARIRAVQR